MMKFVTYTSAGETFYGVATDGGMIALSPLFPQWRSLRDVIADDGLAQLEQSASTMQITHADGDYEYDIPIPNPDKIICVGVNYFDKNSPYYSGSEAPENPALFFRTPRSLVGHQAPLVRPTISDKLDYEAEIAIVIGKGGRHIKQADAYKHIAGITLCNEGSVRDWVVHSKFNVTQGKNFDKSGSIGPWIVPFTQDSQLDDIRLTATVNGSLRQDAQTSDMIFSIRKQIEYISTFTTLVAGDIIVTGTPAGSGARLDPPQFLKPGDMVDVYADGVGTLSNGIVDE